MISQESWQVQKSLSDRVTALVISEESRQGRSIPRCEDYSHDTREAISELNAFYAANPEIVAFFKAQVRSSRNRKFRQFKD